MADREVHCRMMIEGEADYTAESLACTARASLIMSTSIGSSQVMQDLIAELFYKREAMLSPNV